jgi:DNA polymerase-4
LIEDRGIDEIYIDHTDFDEASQPLAQRIKHAVRAATGQSCSDGISPNKLLSKICSELQKPDGITLLAREDVPTRIWPLPVKKINGIGPKANERLAGLGIHSIGDLAHADPGLLQSSFGHAYAAWLYDAAQGIDERPVVTHSEPKSISRETTFDRDLHARHDKAMLSDVFTSLCVRVAEDLQRKGYRGRTIGLKLRFDDFTTVTRDTSLPSPTDDAKLIRRTAGECLKRVVLEKRLRLLGVRVGNLSLASTVDEQENIVQGELPW